MFFCKSSTFNRLQVATQGASHVLEYIPAPLLHALDTKHSFDVPDVPGLR
jgi:hypothetical protein